MPLFIALLAQEFHDIIHIWHFGHNEHLFFLAGEDDFSTNFATIY